MAQTDLERKRRSLTHSGRTTSDAPRGLPWEVWQLVFSHLRIPDLGHASQVCKIWNSLVQSLDGSRWRELYMESSEWKLPYWPLNPDARPPSWKDALREQVLQTRFWYHGNILVDQSQCLGTFRRQRGSYWRRKTIVVGREGKHDTLKSALSVANDYDRILIKPGIYDEQFEMSSKIPLELVGDGELGSVILVMCVEQTSITGRLCNLVIRAPWFTSFALKVKAGYIQVDNCIIEDGLVLIQNPGSGHFRFCTFRHANVILQHVNVSVLENCEFSQCDLAAVSVEGFPKDEVNWAHGHMTYITTVTKETICKDHGEASRSRSSFSIRTKSSDSQQEILHVDGLQTEAGKCPVGNDDGVSVTSSTVIRNVSSWLNNAVETGSQLTLTTEDPPMDSLTKPNFGEGHSLPAESAKNAKKASFQERDKMCLQEVSTENNSSGYGPSADGMHSKHFKQVTDKAELVPQNVTSFTAGANSGSSPINNSGRTSGLLSPEQESQACPSACHSSNNVSNRIEDVASALSVKSGFEGSCSRSKVDQIDLKMSGPCRKSSLESSTSTAQSQCQFPSTHSHSSSESTKAPSMVSRSLHRTARLTNSGNGSQRADNPLMLDSFSDDEDAGALLEQISTAQEQPVDMTATEAERTHGISCESDKPSTSSSKCSSEAFPLNPQANAWCKSQVQTVSVDVHNPPDQLLENPEEQSDMSDPPLNRAGDQPVDRRAPPVQGPILNPEVNPDAEFLLDDLSSDNSSDQDRDNSSTLTSSSEGDTFSHSETSLSDEEMLVRMSYPHHHRALLTRRRNSTQIEMAAVSKQLSVGERATLKSDGMMDLWEDTDVLRAIEEVQGVTIRDCRMNNGKGGVMVSCQGHARVIGCHIANMGYGIRCVQNSRALVLKNEIRHCRTSGIFMRLAASGVIAGNDIHSNMEAGIDVRKNADPVIQGNQIHHGERFGVAVLCSGQGQIRNNDIFANAEAGIYILYRGNPLISDNRLMRNQAAGISVNENGLGMIKDNMISGNMWAGVYIRYGGDPFVQNNVICNGVADGVVVGEKGRGTISKNTVTGNAGCGVWIMGGECPLLHGNTISNNGDAGIAFVTNGPMNTEPGVRGHGSQGHSPASLALQELLIDEKRDTRPHYSQTKVVHNTVCHNTGHGISVESGKDVLLGSNSIYGNSQSGVYINHPKSVTVHNNHITCNLLTGISSSELGQTNIVGNGVFDNRADGIHCQNEAVIKENDIINSQSESAGITLKGTSEIKVERNRVYSMTNVILLNESVRGVVRDNQIYSNHENPIATTSSSKVKVMDNVIVTLDSTSPSGSPPPLPWKPGDPTSRPHVEEPGDLPIQAPARYVRSVARVTVLEAGNCQGGSRTCVLV